MLRRLGKWLLAVTGVLCIVKLAQPVSKTFDTPQAGWQADVSPSIATSSIQDARTVSNRAHQMLVERPQADWPIYLGAVVKMSCSGKRAFFMGMGKEGDASGHAFWSVECADGRKYVVDISPDAVGSTALVDCKFLEKKSGQPVCFRAIRR